MSNFPSSSASTLNPAIADEAKASRTEAFSAASELTAR